VVNPQPDFRSARKRSACLDEAAEGAQVPRKRRKMCFQININHFDSGHKPVPRGAMCLYLHLAEYEPVPPGLWHVGTDLCPLTYLVSCPGSYVKDPYSLHFSSCSRPNNFHGGEKWDVTYQ
jgi:hypothetical protein